MTKFSMRSRVGQKLAWLLPILPLLVGCVIPPPNFTGTASETNQAVTQPAGDSAAVVTEANGLTAEQQLLLAQLPSKGPAPELTNEVWLNTETYGGGALQLADLRGSVVIVEFWTYG